MSSEQRNQFFHVEIRLPENTTQRSALDVSGVVRNDDP
jgi:hypothetical protein